MRFVSHVLMQQLTRYQLTSHEQHLVSLCPEADVWFLVPRGKISRLCPPHVFSYADSRYFCSSPPCLWCPLPWWGPGQLHQLAYPSIRHCLCHSWTFCFYIHITKASNVLSLFLVCFMVPYEKDEYDQHRVSLTAEKVASFNQSTGLRITNTVLTPSELLYTL